MSYYPYCQEDEFGSIFVNDFYWVNDGKNDVIVPDTYDNRPIRYIQMWSNRFHGKSINNVIIGKNVEYIFGSGSGENITYFIHYATIGSIRFAEDSALFQIYSNAIVGCNIGELILPDSFNPPTYALDSNYRGAFYNSTIGKLSIFINKNTLDQNGDLINLWGRQEDPILTELVIRCGDLKKVPDGYCMNCRIASTITIINAETIESNSFSFSRVGYNHYTSNLNLPNGLKRIENRAFYNRGILNVVFPNSLKFIGEYNFPNQILLDSEAEPKYVFENVENLLISQYAFHELYSTYTRPINIYFLQKTPGISVSSTSFGQYGSVKCYIQTGSYQSYNSLFTNAGIIVPITFINNKWFDFSIVDFSNLKIIGYGAYSEDATIIIPQRAENLNMPIIAIDENGLQNGNHLVTLSIGDGISSIGENAFNNCSNLESVTIGSGVQDLSNTIFSNCPNIESLTVSQANLVYRSEGNSIIRKEDNELIIGCKGTIIPSSVKSIGEYAFATSGLTSITIPNTITAIGKNAFYDCSDLTQVDCRANISTIPESAFQNCTSLTSILFNGYLFEIGKTVFKGCTSLQTINLKSTIMKIAEGAFSGCTSLATVNYPNTLRDWCVTWIDDETANPCKNGSVLRCNETPISGVKVIDNIKCVNDNTLLNEIDGLTKIWFKYGIQHIGANNTIPIVYSGTAADFAEICPNQTGMSINYLNNSESSVTFTDPDDFTFETMVDGTDVAVAYNGTDIDIVFPAINPTTRNVISRVGAYCFSGNTDITSVTFVDSLKTIDSYAFRGCTSLQSVNLPYSLTSLGEFAFDGCSSLESLMVDLYPNCGDEDITTITATSTYYSDEYNSVVIERTTNKIVAAAHNAGTISIPDDTILTVGAFQETPLIEIEIGSGCTIEDHAFARSSLESITLPSDCVVGDYAFSECEDLESVTFGGTIIPRGCFAGCSNLNTVVSTTVTTLQPLAFLGCSKLETWAGFGSVSTVGEKAFMGCSKFNPSISNLTAIGDYGFYGSGLSGSLTIPSTLVAIGEYAFASCGISSVTCSNSFTSKYQFANCSSLVTVDFSSISSYGFGCLCDCSSITSLTVNNAVTHISKLFGEFVENSYYTPIGLTSITINNLSGATQTKGAFSYFNNLESVTLGNGITKIEDEWFTWCTNLSSITFPANNSLTTIGKYAFAFDDALESFSIVESVPNYTLPTGVVTVDDSAFFRCGLKSIVVADATRTIGDWAFAMNPFDSSINLKGVTSIGANAFFKCIVDDEDGLEEVEIGTALTSIGDGAFSNCAKLATIDLTGCSQLNHIGVGAFYKTLLVSEEANSFADIAKYKIVKKNGNTYTSISSDVQNPFTYVLGQTYSVSSLYPISLCKTGLHYCTNLFELFNQYGGDIGTDCEILSVTVPSDAKTLTEVGGTSGEHDTFGICCSNSIVIGAALPSWKSKLKSPANVNNS